MLANEISEIIQYHISKKMLIKVERDGRETIIGFPIMLSERFLLMTVINDFHNEGYAIVKADDITDAYSDKSDAFYEKICISEGLQDFLKPEFLNELSDYRQILNDLKNYDGLISIQCEEQVDKCNFYLGKIKETQEKAVEFLSVGMDGRWDSQTDIIPFTQITQIDFDDNYSKLFYKYITK